MRTLLLFLLVAVAVFIGLAFYFNWIDLSFKRPPSGGSSEVSVKINENQAKEDLNEAGRRVREAAQDVRENVREGIERVKREQTVKGSLESVDATQGTIMVKPEGGTVMMLQLSDDTRISIGDRAATRNDLKPGQIVTCKHVSRDGKQVCKSVTVELNK